LNFRQDAESTLYARAALASGGALPENVNYAVKSSYLLSFLESVPEVSAKLKDRRRRSGSLRTWSKLLNKLPCWFWCIDFKPRNTLNMRTKNKNNGRSFPFYLSHISRGSRLVF